MNTRSFCLLVLFGLLVIAPACSINTLVMNKVANVLTAPGGGTVFTSDNDPELVADALPFAIKMYESLMVSIPGHVGLKLRTGSLYVMYANAFLQTPASLLGEAEYKRQEFMYKRAKNLYLRGRDIVMSALELKYPGFTKALDGKDYHKALAPTGKEDVPLLYWAGAGWLAAFAIDPFDMEIGITMPRAAAMLERVILLDEGFERGSIHELFISYYGSLPEYMGGSMAKAREHAAKALEFAKGKSGGPYLALANTVSVQEQNLEEYKTLLGKVLEVSPDADPDNRLVHILNQRKARWLLEHADEMFVEGADKKGQ